MVKHVRETIPFPEHHGGNDRRPSRRHVLTGAGATLASLAAAPLGLLPSSSAASELELPALDRLSVRIISDDAASAAAAVRQMANLVVEEIGQASPGETRQSELVNEPRLSLHVRTLRGTEMRNILFDFGCSPAALNNNMARLRIDSSTMDQVVSREHMPQFSKLPRAGRRWTPTVSVADHGFSPILGSVPAKGGSRSSDGTNHIPDPRDAGDRCAVAPTDIIVSFLLLCRGLVIVTSYRPGHVLDAIRVVQATSGVADIHAVVIAADPAQRASGREIHDDLADIASLSPDHLVIHHGSGQNFFEAAEEVMPGRVVRTTLGMRLSFVL